MQYSPFQANILLSPNTCITIPRYQRKYEWEPQNAHSLIRDIAEIATDASEQPHWTGVIIYRSLPQSEKCHLGRGSNHICREIIDGQQRLTTIQIWLKALLDHARTIGETFNYELTPFYLQSPNNTEFERLSDGESAFSERNKIAIVYSYFRYVLWSGQDALLAPDAITFPRGKRLRGETRIDFWERYTTNHTNEELPPRSSPADIEVLIKYTYEMIQFLAIEIGEKDDAERIYEALNGNRKELYPFDHLRNFVFSHLPPDRRAQIYERNWGPAEATFENMQRSKGKSVDQLKSKFLYDYLISLGEGEFGRFNESRSFDSFKRFERSPRFRTRCGLLEDWVSKKLQDEASIWKIQREEFLHTSLPSGQDLKLTASSRRSLHRIRLLSDGPPAPLAMWILRRTLLGENDVKRFSPEEAEFALKKLEGYLAKTLLSGNSLTNMRASVIKSFRKIDERCVASPQNSAVEQFAREVSTWFHPEARWSQLRHVLRNSENPDSNIYSRLGRNCTLAILDAIDEQSSGPTSTGFLPRNWAYDEPPFWIEHIYPEKGDKWLNNFRTWRIDQTQMTQRLHVLGNLSALPQSVNIRNSNSVFSLKKETVRSDQMAMVSKLQDWTELDQWTPSEIDNRTDDFVELLMKRWPD